MTDDTAVHTAVCDHRLVTARRIVVREWMRNGSIPSGSNGFRDHAHRLLAGECDRELTVRMALAGLNRPAPIHQEPAQ